MFHVERPVIPLLLSSRISQYFYQNSPRLSPRAEQARSDPESLACIDARDREDRCQEYARQDSNLRPTV